MSDSLKTTIQTIVMALITIFGFVGLAEYLPLLEHIHGNVDVIGDAVIKIIEFVAFFLTFKKASQNLTAGSILRVAANNRLSAANEGKASEKSLYDLARKAA